MRTPSNVRGHVANKDLSEQPGSMSGLQLDACVGSSGPASHARSPRKDRAPRTGSGRHIRLQPAATCKAS
eukprot:11837933-Alexandrium_andersonii.AAC.1